MAQGIRRCYQLAMAVVAVVAVLGLAALIDYEIPTPPRYYASILSISPSGVDSNDLDMNISIGVQLRSLMWGWACLDRGTNVVVSYQGLPLAAAATGGGCASPWKLWWLQRTTVVARAPKLARFADGLPRAAAFDVTFRVRSERDHDAKQVTCVARPFLDKATACDVQF